MQNVARHIIMKLTTLILLTLISFNASSQTLRQVLLKQYPKLEAIQIISCKSEPDLFIIILVRQDDWWEDIRVVKFKNGKILHTLKFDTLPTSPAILSARQISLIGFYNPLIEVFDITHNGNGFYYLYELQGQKLKLIASTIAVDYHDDGSLEIENHKYCSRLFKDGKLKPTYLDINKDGIVDIKLTGEIEITGNNYSTKYFAKKVLKYDKIKRKFVEDLKLREGFKKDDE